MRIFEIITEEVGKNYLYHGVSNGKTMAQIVKSGEIKPSEPFDFDRDYGGETQDVISLSRDQFLRHPYGRGVAQLVIDKDALKRAGIKVVPKVGVGVHYKSEAEERVYEPIPVKPPFVVGIQFDPTLKVPKSFTDKVKALGIPVIGWKKVKQQPEEPEYELGFKKSKGKGLADRIENIIATGKEPLPDANSLYLVPFFDTYSIFYKIPGWTHGKEIRPFSYITKEFATKILKQLKDLTKAGQSITPLVKKYSQKQFGKNWQQGRHQLRPGDKGYKDPATL